MKRLSITGISGYIGSRLLLPLAQMPEVEQIIGIDTKPPKYMPSKLKFYYQDISKPFDNIFLQNQVDSAIHLAFILKPTHDRAGARRVNIGGTLNFVEACRKANVKHILYLSSYTVYGAHPDNIAPFKEDSPLRPLPDFQYSWDKVEAEQILTDFASSHPENQTYPRDGG